jgi:hemolysin III
MTIPVNTNRFNEKEEFANAISHLVGAILSVGALVLLVVYSALRGNELHIISSAVFGFSMVFLYMSSFMTHWLPLGKLKDSFFTIDQIAIFILIAGTYTPLSLVALQGPVGWVVFGIEWGLALIGIVRLLSRKNVFTAGVKILDVLLYAGMGWLIVFVAGAVLDRIPLMGFLWIIIGGLFYTIGIVFYKAAKFRYHHLIWHLLVLGGTISHFTAIFFYILP